MYGFITHPWSSGWCWCLTDTQEQLLGDRLHLLIKRAAAVSSDSDLSGLENRWTVPAATMLIVDANIWVVCCFWCCHYVFSFFLCNYNMKKKSVFNDTPVEMNRLKDNPFSPSLRLRCPLCLCALFTSSSNRPVLRFISFVVWASVISADRGKHLVATRERKSTTLFLF